MFLSAHYVGEEMVPKFQRGEPWKKVFGPVFVYLNTLIDNKDPLWLWEDAKQEVLSFYCLTIGRTTLKQSNLDFQTKTQVQCWPYNFLASDDFPKSEQRGCVSGRLRVSDRYSLWLFGLFIC